MRQTLICRLVALLVLFPVGFAASGAALAHGVAHHRAGDDRDHHGAGIAGHAGAPVASHPDHERDHQHPRLDGAFRGRLDTSWTWAGPLARPPVVPVPHLLAASAASSVYHPALPGADRSTGPPPRLRSPPLR